MIRAAGGIEEERRKTLRILIGGPHNVYAPTAESQAPQTNTPAPVKAWFVFMHTWVNWLHLAYILVVLGMYSYEGFFGTHENKEKVIYFGLYLYVVLLFGIFVYYAISSSRQYAQIYNTHYIPHERRARYAEAMRSIRDAVLRLSEANIYLHRCIKEEAEYEAALLQDLMRSALDAVAQAFAVVTGRRNRVCIKVLSGPKGEYTKTFSRDNLSHSESGPKDRDKDEKRTNTVNDNTAFLLIIRGNRPYFFSNDLERYPNYENTSKDKNGRLSYKSTIVCPIGCAQPPVSDARKPLLGLLAVDSDVTDMYDERYDIALLELVAGAVFSVLSRWELAEIFKDSAAGAATNNP